MNETASAPEPVAVAHKTVWAWLIGTFFGIGRLKPGPGTWASVATVGLWRAFAPFASGFQVHAAIAAAVFVTAIGIPASTRVARESGRKDPGFVVIDEVAGQLIALIGVPLGWKTLLASLILFRVFDIVKPPPLRRLEQVPEGAGIMLDDVGAGLYALAVVQGLRHFGLLP
ncbi:MAG: phosphatidylglycerophosphatase A [Acidobacteriia bacterium]|nr:phosphatidylglycerophosphatase A [Terriglobia bacterium]